MTDLDSEGCVNLKFRRGRRVLHGDEGNAAEAVEASGAVDFLPRLASPGCCLDLLNQGMTVFANDFEASSVTVEIQRFWEAL